MDDIVSMVIHVSTSDQEYRWSIHVSSLDVARMLCMLINDYNDLKLNALKIYKYPFCKFQLRDLLVMLIAQVDHIKQKPFTTHVL